MSSAPTAAAPGGVSAGEAISIVQRGNLKSLEATLRKQWRLGQNIVLCWSSSEKAIMALLVPHYFLPLVVADNAIAHETSKGNTVPVIRMAYHTGSYYKLYQA